MAQRRGIFLSCVLTLGTWSVLSPPSLLGAEATPAPSSDAANAEKLKKDQSEKERLEKEKANKGAFEEPQEKAAAREDGEGIFGPLRVGPTIQIGLPHLVNYGLDLLYKKTWGVGFSTGKYSTSLSSTNIQLANWDLRGRWHPWNGSFFLGAAYGQQELFGEAKQNLALTANGVSLTVPTTLQVDVKTNYLTPHLGWFAVWDSGLTLGFELGLQIPVTSSDSVNVAFSNVSPSQEASVKASSQYLSAKKKVDDAAKLLGKQVFPYITLIRLGWLL